MASPNTHRRNAQLAPLKVTEHVITRATPGARTAPGEFRALLAQSIHLSNKRRAEQHADRATGHTIPISGPERRRAKAHRNRGLCVEPVTATRRCTQPAAVAGYCTEHDRQDRKQVSA